MMMTRPQEKQTKSYRGSIPAGVRDESSRRKNTVRESLGAILSNQSCSEYDESEELVTTPAGSIHQRLRRSTGRSLSATTSASPASTSATLSTSGLSFLSPSSLTSPSHSTPRRVKSGGSVLSAAHAAAGKAVRRHSIGKPNNGSLPMDDPFIDALLMGASCGSSSSHNNTNNNTPSSSSRGILGRRFLPKQSKSPSDHRRNKGDGNRQRPQTCSSHLSRSSLFSETEDNSNSNSSYWESSKNNNNKNHNNTTSQLSVSERGTRSIDFFRWAPGLSSSTRSKGSATGSGSGSGSTSVAGARGPCDRARRRSFDDAEEGLFAPEDPPFVVYTPPSRPTLRQHTKKKSEIDDSFYGLEFELDLEDTMQGDDDDDDDTHAQEIYNQQQAPSPKSQQSSSHRRSHRSRSRDSLQRTKNKCYNSSPGGSGSAIRSPSTSSRSKCLISATSICSETLTPTSVSTSQRRNTVLVSSTDGWADLELQDDVDNATICSTEHLDLPAQPAFDGEMSYGEDIDTAMQVGENLMNLGVQLLTRGHDLRMAASRRSSLVGSSSCSPKSCHSKRRGSAAAAAAGAAAYADCVHPDATTAASTSSANVSHFDVEGDLGVILNEKLRALTACHHHLQLDDSRRSHQLQEHEIRVLPKLDLDESSRNEPFDQQKHDNDSSPPLLDETNHRSSQLNENVRSQISSLPSQVLCDDHPNYATNDDDEEDGIANSDIESLSGEVEPDRSHLKLSNRTTHGDGRPSENIIVSGLDHETGKEKSFDSLALQHSAGTLVQEEAVLPMGDNHPKRGKKKVLEDSWSCLELNFSDHKPSHPKKNASEKSKRGSVGRSKSSSTETTKTTRRNRIPRSHSLKSKDHSNVK